MEPGEMPQGEAAEGQEVEGGDVQSQAMEMVKNLSGGLTMFSQMIAQMPEVDPADIEAAETLVTQFQSLVQKLAGGGGDAAPQAQGAKAVPVQSMAGKPMGPAGV